MSENTPVKIPTIDEIVKMELPDTGKENALNVLLNQNPPEKWLKKHPMASNVVYLPIDKVEFLLTKIFVNWFVEIKQVQTLANSAVVTVRLSYQNPITGEYRFQEGVGAAPIHTAKGKGAMDWNEVLTDSVMKATPAAESYAIKDAAEKIGRIFGKDLNRKDLIAYDGLQDSKRFENAKITEK
jgi:hypothetical protein